MKTTDQLLEDLNRAFDSFKAENDRRLKEIETRGTASADVTAAVERANAQIVKIEGALAEAKRQAAEDRVALERLETESARLSAGKKGTDEEREHATRFFQMRAMVRREPIPESGDLEQFRAYRKAFLAFARLGPNHAGLTPEIQAALSVGTDSAGGYLVPTDTGGRMVKLLYESSPMRQIATVSQTSSDGKEGTMDLGETDSGWVSEGVARPETTTPDVGVWRIPVHEQYAQPKASQKTLDDAASDVEGWLEEKIASKFARRENTSFVVGDGAGKPRGFTTYAAGTPTATAWNQIQQIPTGVSGNFAAAPNGGDALIDTVYSLKAPLRAGAVWVMGRLTLAAARKLKDSDGAYLWQPGIVAGQPSSLLGYPVIEFEDMPAIAASSLSIGFGNFKEGYEIVDRIGIRVLRDPYTGKPFVFFYATKRVGGDVVNTEAIKLVRFNT